MFQLMSNVTNTKDHFLLQGPLLKCKYLNVSPCKTTSIESREGWKGFLLLWLVPICPKEEYRWLVALMRTSSLCRRVQGQLTLLHKAYVANTVDTIYDVVIQLQHHNVGVSSPYISKVNVYLFIIGNHKIICPDCKWKVFLFEKYQDVHFRIPTL